MFDALAPAVEALDAALAAGTPLAEALRATAAAAAAGRDATIPMLARKGRASYLGERSVGHQDPGATSTTLLLDGGGRRGGRGLMAARTGLVVVSHSRALADAAVALAREMLHGEPVRDRGRGGAGRHHVRHRRDPDHGGRSRPPTRAQGVVVLMDLGSAVLSAELALELLDEDVRARVVLCPAPLVEGLVVAAVAAAAGADRDEVGGGGGGRPRGQDVAPGRARAARAAPGPAAAPDELDRRLHRGQPARPARPARRRGWCRRCGRSTRGCESATARRDRRGCPRRSLSKVATLGVLSGHEVEVSAGGDQAREALDHLLELAARNFDEPLDGPRRPRRRPGRGPPSGTTPIPTSPGVGIGPAWSPRLAPIDLTGVEAGDPAVEWGGLTDAIAAVRDSVTRVRARAARDVGEAEAAIFDAHLLLLDDADLLADVRARVDGGEPAATRLGRGRRRGSRGDLADLADPYLRARAADVARRARRGAARAARRSGGTAPRRAACWWRRT